MSTLDHYLKTIGRFLAHCQQHLTPDEWDMLTRRLTSATEGSSVEKSWTPRDYIEYYWPRLSATEQAAFVRQQRLARKQERMEVPPCS